MNVHVMGAPPPVGVAVTVIVSPVPPPGTSMRGVLSLVRSSVDEEPESDAEARSGVPGAAGALESIVIGNDVDGLDTFPAASVMVALTFHTPSASEPRSHPVAGTTYEHVTLADPLLAAVIVTVSPATPPTALTVGMLSLVMSSVDDEPKSDGVARSRPLGALDDVESIAISKLCVVPVLPARSTTDAEISHVPSASAPRSHPVEAPTVYEQTTSEEPALRAVTVTTSPVDCPGSEIVGVASLVMLSEELAPESDAAARSGVNPAGPDESIDTGSGLEALDVFPAGSVNLAVMDHVPSASVPRSQPPPGSVYVHVTSADPLLAAVMVTVSPALPPDALMVGVLSAVTLSVLLDPESDAVARPRPDGADGADESTLMDSAVDTDEVPPVGCVSVAVMDHVPSARVPRSQPVAGITYVHVTLAEPDFVAVTVIVSPDSYVPGTSIRGVLSLVTLSVDEEPRSDDSARSGIDGAAGRTDNVPLPFDAE
jgi:hypothetical protein